MLTRLSGAKLKYSDCINIVEYYVIKMEGVWERGARGLENEDRSFIIFCREYTLSSHSSLINFQVLLTRVLEVMMVIGPNHQLRNRAHVSRTHALVLVRPGRFLFRTPLSVYLSVCLEVSVS